MKLPNFFKKKTFIPLDRWKAVLTHLPKNHWLNVRHKFAWSQKTFKQLINSSGHMESTSYSLAKKTSPKSFSGCSPWIFCWIVSLRLNLGNRAISDRFDQGCHFKKSLSSTPGSQSAQNLHKFNEKTLFHQTLTFHCGLTFLPYFFCRRALKLNEFCQIRQNICPYFFFNCFFFWRLKLIENDAGSTKRLLSITY